MPNALHGLPDGSSGPEFAVGGELPAGQVEAAAVGGPGDVVTDAPPPDEAPGPEGVRGSVQPPSRSDLRTLGRAIRSRWRVPKRAYKVVPRKMLELVEQSEDERIVIGAAKVLTDIEKQKAAAEGVAQPKGDTTVSVTVHQHAGDGGTINNGSQAALDAAAAFVRAVAGDAGEPGGAGLVLDAGAVPGASPPGPLEPEAA